MSGGSALPAAARQARLAGPSAALDPRSHAYRPDIADAALADRLIAPRYAEAVEQACRVPEAMLLDAPDGRAVSSLLFGEGFALLDVAAGWAWGRTLTDGYVGFLRASVLGPPLAATWRVAAPGALVFAAPDIKSAVVASLPMNARLAGLAHDDRFVALDAGGAISGFVHVRHVAPLGQVADDPVAAALGFLGTPYRWGGRSRDGIDCSGLVQAALLACGIACPRDSDQQRGSVGTAIGFAARRAGDLLFFPGHVGLLVEGDRLLHANAFAMTTWIEPLDAVLARLRADHAEPVLAVRRVDIAGPAKPLFAQ